MDERVDKTRATSERHKNKSNKSSGGRDTQRNRKRNKQDGSEVSVDNRDEEAKPDAKRSKVTGSPIKGFAKKESTKRDARRSEEVHKRHRGRPNITRIEQLAKPTKSVLLTTWQTYSDVFDYERMRNVMNKLHLEFSLTTQEKRMCMQQMKKNALELQESIAMGSTEEIRRRRIKTEDLRRLQVVAEPSRAVHSSRRTDELAKPKPYRILATWNDYGDMFPMDKRIRFRRKYVEDLARVTECHTQHNRMPIKKQARKISRNHEHMIVIQENERLKAREAAYKLVEKGVQRAMTFAAEGRPPPMMTRSLIKLSDNILSVLSNYHYIKIPPRDSDHKNAKFLLYVADWTAKIISEAYLATEQFDAARKVFVKKRPTISAKRIKETILEQDEQDESVNENIQVDINKPVEIETQTEVTSHEKPFEEIPEIDNTFGNESDWDGEERKQQADVEIKKLTITNSTTEIIHIRESDKEKKPLQRNEETMEETNEKKEKDGGTGDQIDEIDDKQKVNLNDEDQSYEDLTEEVYTDISTD